MQRHAMYPNERKRLDPKLKLLERRVCSEGVLEILRPRLESIEAALEALRHCSPMGQMGASYEYYGSRREIILRLDF